MAEKAIYTHGHHASVVSSHARRTAQDSAAFLLPHIKPSDRILDLGCGPGSITVGLAKLVPDGSVVGGDAVEDVLSQARDLAAQEGVKNTAFRTLDGNALPFSDGEFDICYCHQVLQHVGDPVGILKEMKRVTKKSGIVAARDADYRSFVWYPELPGLELWGSIYQKVAKANGAEPNAGRYMKAWAKKAGFASADVEFTWSAWNYQGEAATAFGASWKDRVLHSGFAKTAIEKELAQQEDLQRISDTWKDWSQAEDATIIISSGEILCRVR